MVKCIYLPHYSFNISSETKKKKSFKFIYKHILNVCILRFSLWYNWFLQVKWGVKKETFEAWFIKLQKKNFPLNFFFQNRIDLCCILSLKE